MTTLNDKDVRHLISKQFEIAGIDKTYDDVLGNDNWYDEDVITEEQEHEFYNYLLTYFRKKRLNKTYAKRFTNMFILMWGLRRK